MRTVAFCEIDAKARQVLAKHWPGVPCYDDVRSLTADRLSSDGIIADVICGGFPCQDISSAGKRAGLDGDRSGLWSEIARLVGELRPRYVIVENVAALLSNGMGRVLGDLAALGYDAEWHCIPASAIGAPHRRDRVWIVAYPARLQQGWQEQRTKWERIRQGGQSIAMADPERVGRKQMVESVPSGEIGKRAASEIVHSRITGGRGWWLVEPDVGRVAHGIPGRVDRLKQLGNSVVPQIPEIIGRAIMKVSNSSGVRALDGDRK